jgi:hypothetical protein
MNQDEVKTLQQWLATLSGAMTTRPRFMRPRSIGPRSIGPIGWWVPYTMSPFVMIGPIFMLCFFEGTNRTFFILSQEKSPFFKII